VTAIINAILNTDNQSQRFITCILQIQIALTITVFQTSGLSNPV
jgi:hypothetical protein